jgi:hypothetical protein
VHAAHLEPMRLPIDSLAGDELRSARREAARCVSLFQQVVARHGSLVQAFVRGSPVTAYEHYPSGDVIDTRYGFQCFYHSHRAGSLEHGHLHLFQRAADDARDTSPGHLIAIGVDARGLPVSMFSVNHWVTGGAWRDARATVAALGAARFDSARGHALAGRWLTSFLSLYQPVAERVLRRRDALLQRRRDRGTSWPQLKRDRSLEVISRSRIDWLNDMQRLESSAHNRSG